MITPLSTLKRWFSNFMKPNQEHFWAIFDSFRHKSEKVPMEDIDGLTTALEGTASAEQLQNHLRDSHAHSELLDKKVDKVPGKMLSTNDFTNGLRTKLEGLWNVDISGLLPKGGYTGTAQNLKELIDNIMRILQSPDTELDELREIVAYIKQNKRILQACRTPLMARHPQTTTTMIATHDWDTLTQNMPIVLTGTVGMT